MVGDDGLIRVDCAFCSSSFAMEPKELGQAGGKRSVG